MYSACKWRSQKVNPGFETWHGLYEETQEDLFRTLDKRQAWCVPSFLQSMLAEFGRKTDLCSPLSNPWQVHSLKHQVDGCLDDHPPWAIMTFSIFTVETMLGYEMVSKVQDWTYVFMNAFYPERETCRFSPCSSEPLTQPVHPSPPLGIHPSPHGTQNGLHC